MGIHLLKLSAITTLITGCIFVICSSHQIIDNDDDYALENYIRYDDYIYDKDSRDIIVDLYLKKMNSVFHHGGAEGTDPNIIIQPQVPLKVIHE